MINFFLMLFIYILRNESVQCDLVNKELNNVSNSTVQELEKGFETNLVWISRKSENIHINQSTISFENIYHDRRALWKDGGEINSGSHYWTFISKHTPISLLIGLSNKTFTQFQQPMKCLCYDGALRYGNKILQPDFGPRIKRGDHVGMFIVYKEEHIHMYLDINNKSLGLAYKVPARSLLNAYPVMRFTGTGEMTCLKRDYAPPSLMKMSTILYNGEGDWKLNFLLHTSCKNNTRTALINIPEKLIPVIEVFSESIQPTLYVRFNESLNFILKQNKTKWEIINMEPIINYRHFENFHKSTLSILSVLSGENKWIHKEDVLIITNKKYMSEWIRYRPIPQSYIGSPR